MKDSREERAHRSSQNKSSRCYIWTVFLALHYFYSRNTPQQTIRKIPCRSYSLLVEATAVRNAHSTPDSFINEQSFTRNHSSRLNVHHLFMQIPQQHNSENVLLWICSHIRHYFRFDLATISNNQTSNRIVVNVSSLFLYRLLRLNSRLRSELLEEGCHHPAGWRFVRDREHKFLPISLHAAIHLLFSVVHSLSTRLMSVDLARLRLPLLISTRQSYLWFCYLTDSVSVAVCLVVPQTLLSLDVAVVHIVNTRAKASIRHSCHIFSMFVYFWELFHGRNRNPWWLRVPSKYCFLSLLHYTSLSMRIKTMYSGKSSFANMQTIKMHRKKK